MILVLTLILHSCGGLPECSNEKLTELKISWGEINNISGVREGYLINYKAEVFSIYQDSAMREPQLKKEGTLDDESFCAALRLMRDHALNNQAVLVPADYQHYLEYSNPLFKFYHLGKWNPKYETKANSSYIRAFDSLNLILEENIH